MPCGAGRDPPDRFVASHQVVISANGSVNGPLGVPKVARWTMRMSKSERRLTPYPDGPIMTWSARPEPPGRPFINSRLAAHHRIERKGPNMAKASPLRLLLIVTGSTLRAEEMDRPLGYYLKQRIEGILSASADQAGAKHGHDLSDYQVRVIADFRWIHDEFLQSLPTISLGGPGVNALAHRWLEEVPISLAFNERYFIQMDPDLNEPRVSIWGMDNPTTQIAVSIFLDRFLPPFLERCTLVPATSFDLDDEGEGEAETDLDESEDD